MSEPKSIILTGASRGIGLAIARYLLGQKHLVFLVARTKEPLEALKREFPGQVEFLSADLADFEVCLVLLSKLRLYLSSPNSSWEHSGFEPKSRLRAKVPAFRLELCFQ